MNLILYSAVTAWFMSQITKIIINLIRFRKMDFRMIFGNGGMPSSHSATVCSLATSVGIIKGWDSGLFGMAFIVAMIIMTDAASVRRAVGRQAAVLNAILDDLNNSKLQPEKRLKELLGHTPKEVFVGALCGVFIAVTMCLLFNN